jgi:hypothetical protein
LKSNDLNINEIFINSENLKIGDSIFQQALDILNNQGSVREACELLNKALSLGIGEAGYKLFVLHTQGYYLKKGSREVGKIVLSAADAIKPSGKAKKIIGIRLANEGRITDAEYYLISARDMGVKDTVRHIAALKTHQAGKTIHERCLEALNYLVLNSDLDTEELRETFIQLSEKLEDGYSTKLH